MMMDDRDQRRAYRRQMRYQRRGMRGPLGSLSGGIFLVGLAIAFFASQQAHGWFLPIFFVALALSSLIGSISSANRWGIYGGFHSFFWLLALAFFFLTGWWGWWLVAAGVSMILGALWRPLFAGMLGAGFMGAGMMNQQQQPPYQQPYQAPYQAPTSDPAPQPYQQGYQPAPQPQAPESYQEGGQPHPYPQQAQYDEPQNAYPKEELPPQQM